jgi:hypothetical protein
MKLSRTKHTSNYSDRLTPHTSPIHQPIDRSNLREDPFGGPKEPQNFDPPVYESAPPYSEHHYRRLALFRELRREVRRREQRREAKEAKRRRKEGRRMTLDELKAARMKKEAAEKVKQEALERERKELLAKARQRRIALGESFRRIC